MSVIFIHSFVVPSHKRAKYSHPFLYLPQKVIQIGSHRGKGERLYFKEGIPQLLSLVALNTYNVVPVMDKRERFNNKVRWQERHQKSILGPKDTKYRLHHSEFGLRSPPVDRKISKKIPNVCPYVC